MKLDHFPAELQAWISAVTNESNSVNRMLYVNNFGMINKRGLSNESCGTHSKPLNVDTPPDHETISSEPCGTVSKFTNNDTHPDHETISAYLDERECKFRTRTQYPVVVFSLGNIKHIEVIDFPRLDKHDVEDVHESCIAIGAEIYALSKTYELPEPTPISEIELENNEYIIMIPID